MQLRMNTIATFFCRLGKCPHTYTCILQICPNSINLCLQIEEKLRKKQEEEDAKRAKAKMKDPKDSKGAKEDGAKDKGPSVKNKFQNDGNFMAQFRQQMKVSQSAKIRFNK